jgi:hypothetical protein
VSVKTQNIGPVLTNGKSISGSGGTGISVKLTAPGSSYTTEPTVAITGGTGSGATAHAQINKLTGEVIAIVIDTPGTYTMAPSVSITGGGSLASGAMATASLADNGTGDFKPADVIGFSISPDENVLYPGALATAHAESHAVLSMPVSSPAVINSGDTIVVAVNVQQWRLALYIIETITVLVP